MSTKIYIKDYWNIKPIIIAKSDRDKGLIAIGEEIDGGERYIHINIRDLINALMELNFDSVNVSFGGEKK